MRLREILKQNEAENAMGKTGQKGVKPMCEDKYLEWISRYIDGDLNEDETKELGSAFQNMQ